MKFLHEGVGVDLDNEKLSVIRQLICETIRVIDG